MKNFLFFFFFSCLFISNVQAQSFNQLYYRDGMYFFDGMAKIRQQDVFTVHKAQFGLGSNDSMDLEREQIVESGKFRAAYRQYHKGVRVESGLMNVTGDKKVAYTACGFLVKGLDIDDSYTVPEDSALITALSFFGATHYPWLDTACINNNKEILDDSTAVLEPPKGSLIIVKLRADSLNDSASNYARCWHFTIETGDSISAKDVYVDAKTNTVFTSQKSRKEWSTAIGTGWTPYDGWYNNLFTKRPGIGFNYQLGDLIRHLETVKRLPGYKLTGWKDNNNDWVESDSKTAASAHWSIQRAFDYFYLMHGHAGMNGSWGDMQIVTDASTAEIEEGNAGYRYDKSSRIDKIALAPDAGGQSMAMLDVMGHEYTHGVLKHTSDIGANEFDYESVSLAEAFCDIFGHRIESFVKGSTDWSIGENHGTNKRNIYDPTQDNGTSIYNGGKSSDYYHHPIYWLWTANNGKYANGGVMRKWFYWMSQGDIFWSPITGIPVSYPGVGMEKASKIAYVGMRWWFWSNLNYEQAAQQLVNHVMTDYGRCSKEHKLTARILRALGFNNISNFFCANDLEIIGDRTRNVPHTGIALYRVKQNNNNDDDSGQPLSGTYSWAIPSGWSASQSGDSLRVFSFSDYSSKKLVVTFTSSDSTVVKKDSIVVHFSSDIWVANDTNSNNQFRITDPNIEQQSEISVFPNPANDYVVIGLPHIVTKGFMTISDLYGKQVYDSELNNLENRVDISKLASGTYIVKVQQNAEIKIQKLTVTH